MKSLLILLAASTFSSISHAQPIELKCRSVEGSTLFESLSITMARPDDQNGSIAPGEWKSQSVSFTYGAASERVTVKKPFRQLSGDNILKGQFEIGYDFGTANVLLVHDYDNKEVVAVFQVSTDGPITVETQRCK